MDSKVVSLVTASTELLVAAGGVGTKREQVGRHGRCRAVSWRVAWWVPAQETLDSSVARGQERGPQQGVRGAREL